MAADKLRDGRSDAVSGPSSTRRPRRSRESRYVIPRPTTSHTLRRTRLTAAAMWRSRVPALVRGITDTVRSSRVNFFVRPGLH